MGIDTPHMHIIVKRILYLSITKYIAYSLSYPPTYISFIYNSLNPHPLGTFSACLLYYFVLSFSISSVTSKLNWLHSLCHILLSQNKLYILHAQIFKLHSLFKTMKVTKHYNYNLNNVIYIKKILFHKSYFCVAGRDTDPEWMRQGYRDDIIVHISCDVSCDVNNGWW